MIERTIASLHQLREYLREAKTLARIAGAVQRAAHDEHKTLGGSMSNFTIDSKSLVDLVTSVDREYES